MGQYQCAPPDSLALDELCLPERLAVWALRCVGHEPRICHTRARRATPGLIDELHAVIRPLQTFQMQMQAEGRAGLRLADWGTLHLTRDERRLLRAVAALQAGQTGLADNFLFRFAPSLRARPGLTEAIAALAATLAAWGYWLPQPEETWSVPVGRAHRANLSDLKIAWP